MQERVQFQKQINELTHIVESNEQFNKEQQEKAKHNLELVLYYQQMMYELLEDTGLLDVPEEESILSQEKRVAIQELFEINRERIRADQEQDKTFKQPDEKLKLKRLEKFISEFHNVVENVDFSQIFNSYYLYINRKNEAIEKMTDEFVKLGVLDVGDHD